MKVLELGYIAISKLVYNSVIWEPARLVFVFKHGRTTIFENQILSRDRE